MSDLIGNFDFDQSDKFLEESFEETKDVDNSMYRESIVGESGQNPEGAIGVNESFRSLYKTVIGTN
jgi:hypothetical protein